MAFDRRKFLVGGAAAAAFGTAAGRAAAVTPDLWAEFTANPYDHPQIPNVAYAGYRTGERPPRRPVRANVLRFGAKNDGSADASAAINRAVETVGRCGGGTVLVPAGTYRIDDVIRVGYDDVVLRGEGSGRTVLHATRSLEEVVGINRSRYGSENSAWSWSGGLVWVCHRDRYQPLIDAIKAHRWPFEGWTGNEGDVGEDLTTLAEAAPRGSARAAQARRRRPVRAAEAHVR